MELLDVLKSRKSVRYYDSEVKISEVEIKAMLAEALTAPSGNNLQPWHVVVVQNPEIKEQLKQASYGQKQVTDAPVVFAFFANTLGYKNAGSIYELAVAAGFMTADAKVKGLENMLAFYGKADKVLVERNAVVDTSLLAMQMMLVVKNHGYDSVPMSGFDSAKVSKILALNETMIPVMILPVGKAIQAAHQTVRLSVDEVATFK
ncbi:MAG: nitroreductase family protein [Culicoidibacterales bacterium]